MPRDFIELENLQANVFSANKFADSCYNRSKQILAEELLKARPDFNITFLDGQKIVNNKSAEYSYLVFPIDVSKKQLTISINDNGIASNHVQFEFAKKDLQFPKMKYTKQ